MSTTNKIEGGREGFEISVFIGGRNFVFAESLKEILTFGGVVLRAESGGEISSELVDEVFGNGTLNTFAFRKTGRSWRGGDGGHCGGVVDFCCGRY